MYRLTKFTVSLVRDSSSMIDGSRRINSSDDIAAVAGDMRLLDREQLRCIFLNVRKEVIGWEIVSQGSLSASIAHPREIFKGAILANCAGIVLVHNHPSGDPDPSEEDIRLTSRIKQAGNILGIELIDHVIMAENGIYSFQKSGRI